MENYLSHMKKISASENLHYYKNLAKLNFKPETLVEYSNTVDNRKLKDNAVGTFDGSDYNLSSILTTEFIFHRGSKFVNYLNTQVGAVLSKKNDERTKKIIREGLIKQFAEMGLLLSFFEFCIKKKIEIKELEPEFFSKKLDLSIDFEGKEIMLEAYAPVAKITEFPTKVTIKSMIDNEVKTHLMNNTREPIIVLIMLNNSWWGGNPLNGGKISDFMLSSVNTCVHLDEEEYDENVSAVILKRGNLFSLQTNKRARFPLSDKFVKRLVSHHFIDRIGGFLKYYWMRKSAKRKFFKLLKKYPDEKQAIIEKGQNPEDIIENYLNFTDRYPF